MERVATMDKNPTQAPQVQREGIGTEGDGTNLDCLNTMASWRAFHLRRHHSDYHNKLMMKTHEVRQTVVESQVRLPGDEVLAAVGPEKKEQVAGSTTDKTSGSAYATTLQQLKDGMKVPPTGWKCCKRDETENLWLNLTDGSIFCGRRNSDGTGGNDHALEHHQETIYPLAVNPDTIPPDSQGADECSYPEDDTVEDPSLAENLAQLGIDFSLLGKTESPTAERELDQNTDVDGDEIPEKGKELEPSFTGLVEVGNSTDPGFWEMLLLGVCVASCIFNEGLSLHQVDVITRDLNDEHVFDYFENVKLDAFKQAPGDPTLDLDIQQ